MKPQNSTMPYSDPLSAGWPAVPGSATGATITQPDPETSNTIHDVEMFEEGTHAGDPYTAQDLQDMLANYNSTAGFFTPPVVIGHENYQPLAEGMGKHGDNTGNPAMGWIDKVRLEHRMRPDGQKRLVMLGTLGDVDDDVADWIRQRKYDKVSLEVYPPDSPDKPPGTKGCAIRRLSLMGGYPPAVKTLASLSKARMEKTPRPYGERVRRYGEGASTPAPRGVRYYAELSHASRQTSEDGKAIRYFFEAERHMDRGATMEQLKGIPSMAQAHLRELEGVPDDEFQRRAHWLLNNSTAYGGGTATDGATMGAMPGAIAAYAEPGMGVDANPQPGQDKAMGTTVPGPANMALGDLARMGEDPNNATVANGMAANPLSPGDPITAPPPPPPDTPPMSPIPLPPADVAKAHAECARMYAEAVRVNRESVRMFGEATKINQMNAAAVKMAADRLNVERATKATELLKKAVEVGVLEPWQADHNSTVYNTAHRLRNASSTTVRKFGEGMRSEFDLVCDEIQALINQRLANPKVRTYGEREVLPDPVAAARGQMSAQRREYLLNCMGTVGKAMVRDERAKRHGAN